MLDRFTFGNNPASLYLVEVLNTIDNKKLNRKITNLIRESRTTLRELIAANEAGKMSTHTVSVLVELLRTKVEHAAHVMKYSENGTGIFKLDDQGDFKLDTLKVSANGELAVNLATNVIKGELKSLHRRARDVHHIEKEQQHLMSKGESDSINRYGILLGTKVTKFEPRKIAVTEVKETITAETLTIKSRAKLTRLNKPCKLY
jgi:hypothetical protein